MLVFLADHEAGDVLQEHQRDAALGAQFDEMRAFLRRFGEQDAVVGDEANRIAVQPGETGDQRGPVAGFEFVEAGAVHQPGDDFAHVVGLAGVGRQDAVHLFGVVGRFLRRVQIEVYRLAAVEIGDDAPGDEQGVGVVFGQMVRHPGNAGVHVAAAQFFGGDDFADSGFDQRRPAEKDGALILDDDRFVRHGRHVGPAGGAGPHHHGDLRDTARRQIGLIEKDAAKVIAVREHFVLHRQERAAGIHQGDAGQGVLAGDFLGAQVLFHRQWVIGAALHRGVVGQDHALLTGHAANAGDDPGAGGVVAVQAPGRQLSDFQEGSAGIEQMIDPVARQQLAAIRVFGPRRCATAKHDLRRLLTQIGNLRPHRLGVGAEFLGPGIDLRFQQRHGSPLQAIPAVDSTPHAVSANSSRPISIRRISLVPAPISYSLASRHSRPAG